MVGTLVARVFGALLHRAPRHAPAVSSDCEGQLQLNVRLLATVRAQDEDLRTLRVAGETLRALTQAHVAFLAHLTAESRATATRVPRLTSRARRDYRDEFTTWCAAYQRELRVEAFHRIWPREKKS